jgi:hypothetical protein
MAVELIHPAEVIRVDGHHQVSVATGSRLISIAGQVSWDAEGQLIGDGDLAAQTEQCYLNVAASLAGAGATMNDITGLTHYIVGQREQTENDGGTGDPPTPRGARRRGVQLIHDIIAAGGSQLQGGRAGDVLHEDPARPERVVGRIRLRRALGGRRGPAVESGTVIHASAAHVHVVAARTGAHPETGNPDTDTDAGRTQIEPKRPGTQTLTSVKTH